MDRILIKKLKWILLLTWTVVVLIILMSLPRMFNSSVHKGSCREQRNVFYLKVHKTGSTTFSNILFNFGITRNLSFPFGKRFELLKHFTPHPQDLLNGSRWEHKFNIIATHTVFNMNQLSNLVPAETQFVATLRHPLSQLRSAVKYYNIDRRIVKASNRQSVVQNAQNSSLKSKSSNITQDALTLILQNNSVKNPRLFRLYARELGMNMKKIGNHTYVRKYLAQLDTVLNVIITEYFDEGLLLLRKMFCWSYKDILYLPLRVQTFSFDFHNAHLEKHRELDPTSYIIYEHFLDKFRNQPVISSSHFQHELAHFRGMLQRFKEFCICRCKNNWQDTDPECRSNQLSFIESDYYSAFVVSQDTCQRLMFSTTTLSFHVATYQYQDYCRKVRITGKGPYKSLPICKNLPQKDISFVDYIKDRFISVPLVFRC